MTDFNKEIDKVMSLISQKGIAVLSTSYNDCVTSRTMSVVTFDNKVAFQTSKYMRKYCQILENENVALCLGDIQLEGIAKDKGKAAEHAKFISLYKEKHPGSYKAYTNLESERVLEIQPTYIQVWKYIDGKPHILKMDIINKIATLIPYYDGDHY